MAEQQQAPVDDRPATFAEGVPVPTVVPETPGVPLSEAPTDEQIHREWNTYVAATDLFVDGARAVPKGGKVPASHPSVPMWLEHGLIKRVDQTAPVAEKPTPTPSEETPQPASPETARRARRERDS